MAILTVEEAKKLMEAKPVANTGDKSKVEDGRIKASYNFSGSYDPEKNGIALWLSLDPEKVAPEMSDNGTVFYCKGAGWNAAEFGLPVKVSVNVYKPKPKTS